ncbi:MYND finger domain containing protein [Nitzschia inconspicua]|uniref:MYND finger domain containing protein n=1 Tax=Nitzschia inconspicua TaxID=303405 RepID=A0A9K3KGF4_9STRA|nr:MYND finger domain containing protein [Nitzschia inconspicua]
MDSQFTTTTPTKCNANETCSDVDFETATISWALKLISSVKNFTRDRSRTNSKNDDKNHKVHCGNCFACPEHPMRCTRCKVVAYCDRECQQIHYKRMHKKPCIGLDKLRGKKKEQEEKEQQLLQEVFDNKSTVHTWTWTGYNLQLEISDWIFQMAYRYSDTIDHGAYMYEVALDAYLEATNELLSFFSSSSVQDTTTTSRQQLLVLELQKRMDHLRLMLVVLDRSSGYLQTLSTPEQSLAPTTTDGMDLVAPISTNITVRIDTPAAQLSILLYKLRSLAKSRESDQLEKRSSNDSNSTELIEQQIKEQLHDSTYRQLWRAFFQRGNHYDQDAMTYKWGPDTLGWDSVDDNENDDNNNNNNEKKLVESLYCASPPRDFYLWLQDFCFFDPAISSVVEDVVEPIISS